MPTTGPLVCWTLAVGTEGYYKGCDSNTEENPFNNCNFRKQIFNFCDHKFPF